MVRLESVTHGAGQAQVRKDALTTVATRVDVLNLKKRCGQFLGSPAVGATIAEAFANGLFYRCRDVGAHDPAAARLS